MKHLLLWLFFAMILTARSLAQLPDNTCSGFGILPSAFCSEACLACDGLDGYAGTNLEFPSWDVPPPFCPLQLNSVNWLAFVAGSPALVLEFTAFNCQNGNGLQAGIYSSPDCASFTSASNCETAIFPSDPTLISAGGLIPGQTYFLVINGNLGDVCEFSISVLSGSTMPPPLTGNLAIGGPAQACPGEVFSYSATGISGANIYNWELNGAALADSGPDIMLNFPQPGAYQLCVTASSPCQNQSQAACLTVNAAPPQPEYVSESICTEELPYNFMGMSFVNSGVYYLDRLLPNGCTQTVVLDLAVIPPVPPTMLQADICSWETFTVGNNSYNQTGNYTALLSSSGGCDSIVLLSLTVHPDVTTNLGIINHCSLLGPYYFQNNPITVPGPFSEVLTSYYGCDSTVSGVLNFIYPEVITLDTGICSGEFVVFMGDTLAAPGLYADTLAALFSGCDTLYQLQLEVFPAPDTLLQVAICEGEAYLLGDSTYTQSGIYIQSYASAAGCDSTITLELTVLQPMDTIQASICQGDSYILGGQVFDSAGVYQLTLTSPSGCQSLVQLELSALVSPATSLTAGICEGEGYEVAGNLYTQSGQYADTLTAANGCDSIVHLSLAVAPTVYTALSGAICQGESYLLGGAPYTQSGIYTAVLASAQGCDSVVTLDLAVLPAVEVSLDTTLCPGEFLNIGPYSFGEPTEGQLHFEGANGCDSTVFLTLAYFDTITVDSVLVLPDRGTILGGSIYAGISGGSPPYSYFWSNGRDSSFIDLLDAGQYFLIVTDASGCQRGFYFTVPFEPAQIPGQTPRNNGGGLLVSPNPFSHEFRLWWQDEEGESSRAVRISLFNLMGQLVWEEEAPDTGSCTLQPRLPGGTYWLVVSRDGKKIGVERLALME